MDLSEEHVTSYRCALNQEHVEQYQLPRSIDAIKEKDSRTPAYRKLFGDLAVELDALRPSLLEDMVRQAIEANLDMTKEAPPPNKAEMDLATRCAYIRQHGEQAFLDLPNNPTEAKPLAEKRRSEMTVEERAQLIREHGSEFYMSLPA